MIAPPDLARYLNFVTSRHGDAEWFAYGQTWRRQANGIWKSHEEAIQHDPKAIERAMAIGAVTQKAYDATPSWDDLKKDRVIGKKLDVRETEDGNKVAKLRGMSVEDKMRIAAMEAEKLGIEAELSEMRSATVESEVLVDSAGRKRHVPVERAAKVARKQGLRPTGRTVKG